MLLLKVNIFYKEVTYLPDTLEASKYLTSKLKLIREDKITPKLTDKDIERYEMNTTRCANIMITEEEKIRRRKIINLNTNICGAGFGEEIDPRINKIPEVELFINGDISFEEYQRAVMKFIETI